MLSKGWRGVEDMETCRVELRGELAKDWLVDWVEEVDRGTTYH